MNGKIIQFYKDIIVKKSMKDIFVAEKSGIESRHLMRTCNQNETISGRELICLSSALEVEQAALMRLHDNVA